MHNNKNNNLNINKNYTPPHYNQWRSRENSIINSLFVSIIKGYFCPFGLSDARTVHPYNSQTKKEIHHTVMYLFYLK